MFDAFAHGERRRRRSRGRHSRLSAPHFVAASWNPGMAHRPGYRVDLGALTATRWRAPETQEGPTMTVLIYVNTSKQVGDPDHLKVFANVDAAEAWFEEMTRKAWHSSIR